MAIFTNLFGQDVDVNIPTLNYHHGLKLDKIQEPGNKFLFKQFCFPGTVIDSVISSGNIAFKGSKIGKIKDCLLQWQIREDTLKAVIIETFKEKNTKQLLQQASSQFGIPIENKSVPNKTYEWRRETSKSDTKAKLVMDKEQKKGILTVTK